MIPLLLIGGAWLMALLVIAFQHTMKFDRIERRYGERISRVSADLERLPIQTRRKASSLRGALESPWMRRVLGCSLGSPPIPKSRLPLVFLVGIGISFLIIAALTIFAGRGVWALFPLILILTIRFIIGYFQRRRTGRLLQQFPDALATISRCIRSGIPLQGALRIVAHDSPQPTATEFGHIRDRMAIGVPIDEALRAVSIENGISEYKFFAAALGLQSRTGGALAQTLETLATVVRKRISAKARGYALASEARTSALILGALPVFSGLAVSALDPQYMAPFFTTAAGKHLFLFAVFLLCFGFYVMKSIINRSLS